MLTHRPVDIDNDGQTVLDLDCLRDWEALPSWARTSSYREYYDGWLATSKPEEVLARLEASLEDERTLAEIWLEDEKPAGFLWVTFDEIGAQDVTFAEVRSLVVATAHQRRGIGGLMLHHAELEALGKGAVCLRSQMAEDNAAARAMHGKQGFTVATYQYEKLLKPSA